MRKYFEIAIVSFILFNLICPVAAQNKINLALNVKQFRFNPDTSLVEIYYGYFGGKNQEKAKLAFELNIYRGKENIVHNIWGIETQASAIDSGKSHVNIDLLKYLLAPGQYNIKLIAKDLTNPQRIDSVEMRDFEVRNFPSQNLAMSDIELAQSIQPFQMAKSQKFVKNKFEVLPNVLNYYDLNNQSVYYYVEIYNLKNKFKGKFFQIKRTILDSQGLPVSAIPVYNKKKRIRGVDDIEVGMFSIEKLPSGKYSLYLAVLDSLGHSLTSQIVPFYVDNPDFTPSLLAVNAPLEEQMKSSEIALIDVADLDMYLGALKYMLPEEERKVVDHLDSEQAKRLYLFRYWKANDPRPETMALESFRDFVYRVQYANKNFSDRQTRGWMSDRGRVLIVYGSPTEIQYYPNVPDFKEFQAWSYDNIENGVVFIFGNIGSFGDLKLLHSTKTGEIHNEAWLDLLKVSHGRTGMADETMGLDAKEYLRRIFRENNLEWPRFLK